MAGPHSVTVVDGLGAARNQRESLCGPGVAVEYGHGRFDCSVCELADSRHLRCGKSNAHLPAPAQGLADMRRDAGFEMGTPLAAPGGERASTLACDSTPKGLVIEQFANDSPQVRQVVAAERHVLTVSEREHHLDVAQILTHERRARA